MGLVLTIHELLSELASHITTQRTDNMFCSVSNEIDASSVVSNYLLDPKEMVGRIKLQQNVQKVTTCKCNNSWPRHESNGKNNAISTISSQPVISRTTIDQPDHRSA